MTSEDVIYTYENLSGLNGEKAISSKFKQHHESGSSPTIIPWL